MLGKTEREGIERTSLIQSCEIRGFHFEMAFLEPIIRNILSPSRPQGLQFLKKIFAEFIF
jgi:hypothetical protein